MEKELGQIRFTKLDEGIRIEMTGEKFKELGDCCMPMMSGRMMSVACCGTEKSDCCQPEKKE